HSAFAFALLRNQTTVAGHVGAVEAGSARATFSFAPNRRLTAYVTPSALRSRQEPFRGLVYQTTLGARWAVTTLLSADLMYSHDMQHGAVDPAWPNATFSHSTLSFGLTTRWNNPDGTR